MAVSSKYTPEGGSASLGGEESYFPLGGEVCGVEFGVFYRL